MVVAHAAKTGRRCCRAGFCAPNCGGVATEPLLLEFYMVGSRLKIRVSLVRFRLRPPFSNYDFTRPVLTSDSHVMPSHVMPSDVRAR